MDYSIELTKKALEIIKSLDDEWVLTTERNPDIKLDNLTHYEKYGRYCGEFLVLTNELNFIKLSYITPDQIKKKTSGSHWMAKGAWTKYFSLHIVQPPYPDASYRDLLDEPIIAFKRITEEDKNKTYPAIF